MSITVVIPTTRDRVDSLARAVWSARGADELLVYENSDGSPAKSISKAIDNAKSDWLMVLADDDWLLPGALDRIKPHLAGDMVFSDLYVSDGTAIRDAWRFNDRPTDPDALVDFCREHRMNPIPMLGPWRVSWLRENKLRFIEWATTGYADDCRTFLEWAKHSPDIRYVRGPFHVYVQHDGALSKNTEERAKYLAELDAYFKGEA